MPEPPRQRDIREMAGDRAVARAARSRALQNALARLAPRNTEGAVFAADFANYGGAVANLLFPTDDFPTATIREEEPMPAADPAPVFVPPGGEPAPVFTPANGLDGVVKHPDGTNQRCVNCRKPGTLKYVPNDTPGVVKCTACEYMSYSAEFDQFQTRFFEWQDRIAESMKAFRIWNYTHKPTPKFFGRSGEGLFFGIENELEVPVEIAKEQVAYELYEAAGKSDLIYFKQDGTLTNGIEIVTQPMSFDYFMTKFPEGTADVMANRMRNYVSRRGGKVEQCGLHIHMSRKAFGPETVLERPPNGWDDATERPVREGQKRRAPYHLYKFAKFIYDNPDFVRFIAGREGCVTTQGREMCSYDMSKLGFRKTFDHHSKQYILSNNLQLREVARGKVLVGHDRRYMALNFDPQDTVELRVFKATSNLKRIRADVQFCDAAFYYTKKYKLHCKYDPAQEISEEGFKRFVTARPTRYADLIGLLNNDPAYAA